MTGESLTFEPVRVPDPWRAFRVALPSFPLPPSWRTSLGHFMVRFLNAVGTSAGLHPTLWLDSAELHHDNGSRIFSSNARHWSPTMGFCFDPTGPRPRTMEFSDLTDVEYGTHPQIYNRSSIFVSNIKNTVSAYESLAGRGIASFLFFAADAPLSPALEKAVGSFMENSRAALEPLVASNSFRHHHFYFPLLSSNSLASVEAKDLQAWMGNAELYLHEVFSPSELLLVTSRDITPVFHSLGMHCLAPGNDQAPWSISVEPLKGSNA